MHLNHIIKTPETFTYLPGPTEQAVVYVGDYSVVANVQLQPGWELPAGSAVTEKAHVFHIPAFGPMNHPLTAARDLVGGWQVTYEHEVAEIRMKAGLGASFRELADMFRVHPSTIGRIVKGVYHQ